MDTYYISDRGLMCAILYIMCSSYDEFFLCFWKSFGTKNVYFCLSFSFFALTFEYEIGV